MRRFFGTLASTLLLATIACDPPAPAPGAPAMFRGDPSHSGIFETAGVEERPGLLWRFETGGPIWSSPVVSGGVVYIGSTDGSFYALDKQTGEQRWAARVGSPVSSTAAVAEGLAVFASRDGVIRGVDAVTGEAQWQFGTGPTVEWEWGFEGWDVYVSSPVVQDSVVVVGAGDGVVYALDLHTGVELWRHETAGRIRATPAIADGSVYAGSTDGTVYALGLDDGEVQWRFDTEGASAVSADMGVDRKSIIASPLVTGGSVYVGSRDGYMYALDQQTGTERWRVSHEGSWAISSPTVDGEALFSGTSDGSFVHRVDVSTGEEVWRFVGEGYTWSSPALVDRTVYIGDGGGYLRALDTETGAERWHYPTPGGVYSSPWVEDGVVFFGTVDGSVYAVGEAAPAAYRAVFWDEELAPLAWVPDIEPRVFFEQRGYEVLDADGLAAFMEARVTDAARSVVVFAVDRAPPTVAAEPADTVLLRRYLDAGGKVVWMGLPPLSLAENDAGQVYFDRSGPERLLGVDYGEANFDYYGAQPTELGQAWGLRSGWASTLALDADQDVDVLAMDEYGRAAAWAKSYGGPEGSGFVGIGLHLVTPQTLDEVHALAEYGLR